VELKLWWLLGKNNQSSAPPMQLGTQIDGAVFGKIVASSQLRAHLTHKRGSNEQVLAARI